MKYQIVIQPTAFKSLKLIRDRRIQEKIVERIDGLCIDPEKQGKVLMGAFKGYRSLRAVGQRYRIIYRVEKKKIFVSVVALGIRKDGAKDDVYELARKLFRQRLL